MALKSYCEGQRIAYNYEREAFTGLRAHEEVPIVRYFGSYTHDYGEGPDKAGNQRATYNILLEYGQNNLFESWADETNVPPVRAEEILRSWESLFKISYAVRQIHKVDIPHSNGTLKFNGWHADIKPDNILMVNGQLKLADFGYSKFVRAKGSQDDITPTELITGFTDTYGAPELSRLSGTVTGVTQLIDTWSFGCVLSVAATWIVLGYQGILQYHKLRTCAPTNMKIEQGQTHDRFHDGMQVLPEIKKWHDYLRGHLRSSDTITSRVLDLVELKMLQGVSEDRLPSDALCDELADLVVVARENLKRLGKYARNTDPVVLEALLAFEKEAQEQGPSEPAHVPLSRQVVPLLRAEMHAKKEEVIKSKPLGSTTHRKELLRDQLRNQRNLPIAYHTSPSDRHNGALADSPSELGPFIDLFATPRNNHDRIASVNVASSDSPEQKAPSKDHLHLETPIQATGRRPALDHASGSSITQDFRASAPNSPDRGNLPGFSDAVPSFLISQPTLQGESQSWSNTLEDPSNNLESAVYPRTQQMNHTPQNYEHLWRDGPSQRTDPNLPEASPHRRFHGPNVMPERAQTTGPRLHEQPGSPQFSPGIHQNGASRVSYAGSRTTRSRSNRNSNQDLGLGILQKNAKNSGTIPLPAIQAVPSDPRDLPYEVCERRKIFDQEVPSSRIRNFKNKIGLETREKDFTLEQLFKRRELVFVFDNGFTMFKHWPIVRFVAETLATCAAGLDKSGFDLRFTIDGENHNKDGLSGEKGRKFLSNKLVQAEPDNRHHEKSQTDMGRIFEGLKNDWLRGGKRDTTLFLFTDGEWCQRELDKFKKVIIDIAKLDGFTGRRRFSVQLIRFGYSEEAKRELQKLDDDLCGPGECRDIIDHCSWRAPINKIFRGSIEPGADEDEPEEADWRFNYDELLKTFKDFNEIHSTPLSPKSPPWSHSRTPSYGPQTPQTPQTPPSFGFPTPQVNSNATRQSAFSRSYYA